MDVLGQFLKNKFNDQELSIARIIAQSEEGLSLPEIAQLTSLSVPTVTKIANHLVEGEVIMISHKRESDKGRKPNVFALAQDKFYAVGVEILSRFIQVSIWSFDQKKIAEKTRRDFVLKNTQECLEEIVTIIRSTIETSGVDKDQILGVGVGIVESNDDFLSATDYFNFNGILLKDHLSEVLAFQVFIDYDTRLIAIAEKLIGEASETKHAVILKISRKIGMGMFLNDWLHTASHRRAGKIAHIKTPHSNKICQCGKTGCLGTVLGGNALAEDFREAKNEGKESIISYEVDSEIDYHHILDAAVKGDQLSLELIVRQGTILGESLANIVNLLNPEKVIIAGEYVMLGDVFIDAIRLGMRKNALVANFDDCEVCISSLGRFLGSRAGALFVFYSYRFMT